VAPRRDSGGLGGGIEGFGRVLAVACFLGGTLGSNCCKAFRLVLVFLLCDPARSTFGPQPTV